MTQAGRFEEMGHALCREIVVALCEDESAVRSYLPTGFGYAFMAVEAAWFLASPFIYGGRALDRLLRHDPSGLDAGSFEFPHGMACGGSRGDDPEVPPVVVEG